jgi:hypothetical protein
MSIDLSEFKQLLEKMAAGWNEGNPSKSLECFTKDATYIEPPNKQFFQGHDQLYIYFGGDGAKPGQMKLVWHGIFFDEEKQTGAGEYTFEMNDIIHHGVAVVELEEGKIKFWREYDFPGVISFNEFIKIDNKNFAFTSKNFEK